MVAMVRLSVLAMLAAGTATADSAEEGRTLAARWCADCHAIDRETATATDAAPAFATLAQTRSDAALADWLAAPHAPMPDPGLSRAQIDALVAHIASLR